MMLKLFLPQDRLRHRKRSKCILAVALVLSHGLLTIRSFARSSTAVTNDEPRYLDKSLSEWIPLARLTGGDIIVPGDGRAFGAVREIGTNAIPWLLQWLRSSDPRMAEIGVEGFGLLGPKAKQALPKLHQMAYDWQTSNAWSNAILALATMHDSDGHSYTFADLAALATNQSAPSDVRALAIKSAADYSTGVAFIQCLQDKDWRVAQAAANGLNYCTNPKLAVPALSACLLSRTNAPGDAAVRHGAARALGTLAELIHYPAGRSKSELDGLRQAMAEAVPALVKALEDEDWRIARTAVMALGEATIEPEVVVPALVESLNYPYPDKYGDVRRDSIVALGNFGQAAKAAVPALTKIAKSDPDGYVGGGFAASALGKIVPKDK